MKKNLIRFPALAFTAAAITLGGMPAAFADTTTSIPSTATTAPADTGWHHHPHHHGASMLTVAEKAQLRTAKEKALAANPALAQDRHALKKQYKALAKSGATKEQFAALHPQKEALKAKIRSAELLIDPSLSTVFAKLDAAKASHKHSA